MRRTAEAPTEQDRHVPAGDDSGDSDFYDASASENEAYVGEKKQSPSPKPKALSFQTTEEKRMRVADVVACGVEAAASLQGAQIPQPSGGLDNIRTNGMR